MKFILLVAVLFVTMWGIAVTVNAQDIDTLNANSHQVFDWINQERARIGIPELIWDDELAAVATDYSVWMAETDKYVHSGYPGVSENIMVGSDPEDVYTAWLNSEWHYMILTDERMKYGAVGMGLVLHKWEFDKFSITYNTSKAYATFMASFAPQ